MGPDLAEKYPYRLEMLIEGTAPSEEDILEVFQFQWRGIILLGVRKNEY